MHTIVKNRQIMSTFKQWAVENFTCHFMLFYDIIEKPLFFYKNKH
ncbi:hypothetical protein FM106_04260 [Brachybacterium faecium]|nr:hypothetical protein FM106_04260 [Brachybacterium faecium]